MIICHEKRLIFIKTKKTAGTSFEIALSKFCGADCVITPISPADEALRKSLGFRTAQNFIRRGTNASGVPTEAKLFNHMPAHLVRLFASERVWTGYRKVTIVRNPFDYAISRYYWEGGPGSGSSFLDYLRRCPAHLSENRLIAPLDGEHKLDHYLRYEDLQNEFLRADLGYLWDCFRGIRAKGNVRPRTGASTDEIYQTYPEAVSIIESTCRQELEMFGYRLKDSRG